MSKRLGRDIHCKDNASSWYLLLLFLTFSVLVANPKKLLYTVANPARGLLNREKTKSLAAHPPRAARSEKTT